mgnify:CR=1 FL=1
MDLISILRLTPISISNPTRRGECSALPWTPPVRARYPACPEPNLMRRQVPKRRTHPRGARNKMVGIRMTEDDYALKVAQARELGLTPSGLCERLVLEGKVEMNAGPSYKLMDPALFTELRRIGNNINQIAHAVNGNLPPDQMMAWRSIHGLLTNLLAAELIKQKTSALRTRTDDDGTPPPQARDVFQRSVRVHPARRPEDFP